MSIYSYRHVISNERTCYWMLHHLRWPGKVTCPRCLSTSSWTMREKWRPKYRCKDCRYHFSLLTGTDLHGTRLPLTKWVLAAALFSIGISSLALSREIEVSQRIAWNMLQKFRKAIQSSQILRKLRGSVEVDETYIGGRAKGKRGRGAGHKAIVIGFRTRTGKVRSMVVESIKTKQMQKLLKQQVAQGTRLYTDEYSIYHPVRKWGFKHRRIKHSKWFVRGQTHTQGIEGYWGHLKPTLVGRHRSVSPKHLPEYLAEADVKHNLGLDADFTDLILRCLLSK
jgi:transposase-like protein